MTTWKRSDSFYLGAYPVIAYAGAKWSGLIHNEEDRVNVYAALLDGSKDCARALLAMNIVEIGSFGDITKVAENDYMLKLMYRDALVPALYCLDKYKRKMKGRAKDILTDIYDYILEIRLNLAMQKLATEIFDRYESEHISERYLLEKLDEVEAGFSMIYRNGKQLWKKYRKGIRSCRNAFENKFKNIFAKTEKIRSGLCEKNRGVLYVDLMLHDPYPTVKNEIRLIYPDGEELLYKGSLKPTIAQFETGGCYGYRFATQNRLPEKIRFASYGEGAIYPLHFRMTCGGKKYIAHTVLVLEGKVNGVEHVLTDDTQFAEMGENDGIAHFNDIELSRVRHEIEITLHPLAEG